MNLRKQGSSASGAHFVVIADTLPNCFGVRQIFGSLQLLFVVTVCTRDKDKQAEQVIDAGARLVSSGPEPGLPQIGIIPEADMQGSTPK